MFSKPTYLGLTYIIETLTAMLRAMEEHVCYEIVFLHTNMCTLAKYRSSKPLLKYRSFSYRNILGCVEHCLA